MRVVAGTAAIALSCMLAAAWTPGAAATELPAIKVSDGNAVPECATPGRLMAFLSQRNPRLNLSRYDAIATEYLRHGQDLGVRWDIAFFQMLVETGNLTYTGDVRADQFNFAGLGATGNGARGESFKSLSAGVRAHLQHVLMYTGEKIQDPVAERTRNVQDWGVLTSWQKSIKGPITFAHLAKKWAPSTPGYARDISFVAEAFYDRACKGPDPRPELMAEASRGHAGTSGVTADPSGAAPAGKGAEIAEKAIAEERASGAPKSALGAAELAKAAASTSIVNREAPGPNVTILNSTPSADDEASVASPDSAAAPQADGSEAPDSGKTEVASVAGAATAEASKSASAKASRKPAQKCRVWTASYGGSKAIIIRAPASGATNYTVLDVNEGSEKREADAYIMAYARGGELVGEFGSQGQALDKAFELCPED